jgi:hypothetical protein
VSCSGVSWGTKLIGEYKGKRIDCKNGCVVEGISENAVSSFKMKLLILHSLQYPTPIMPNPRLSPSAARFSPEPCRSHRYWINASFLTCRQPIRVVVYPHILNRKRQTAIQAAIVCCWQCTRWWLPTSLLKITHCHRSTLLCRWHHHASEVQQLFSTHSVSGVSWGTVRSLMKGRNTPSWPGWHLWT